MEITKTVANKGPAWPHAIPGGLVLVNCNFNSISMRYSSRSDRLFLKAKATLWGVR
jgi:hypothetical protein